MASNAGRAVRFAVPPLRGWGGAAPGYLLTNCRVRGQSLQGGRVCSLLRGHPDTTPPHGLVRGQPPEGGRGRHRYRASPQPPPPPLQLATKINGRRPCPPPTGGTTPTRRKGGDVPGCPRSKLPCSAALKRLTPHLAVCEEVPRCGPARPTRRTHREPLQPGRRLRPVSDPQGHGEHSGAEPNHTKPQPGRRLRPVGDPQGHGGHGGAEPNHTKPQPGRRLRPYVTATVGVGREGTRPAISKPGRRLRPSRTGLSRPAGRSAAQPLPSPAGA